MKFKDAYNLIIDAYFKDQIRPMVACFCVCGTLCNNNSPWESDYYSHHELKRIEFALLNKLSGLYTKLIYIDDNFYWTWVDEYNKEEPKTKEYEDALFSGICAALDVLKIIHIEKGENIEDEIASITQRSI